MFPCISVKSLKLLVGTADERYSFSPEYFRRTHFPQVLHRYYKDQLVQEVTEQELFDTIQEEITFGNRIYTIIGSTGSGKSELLCWLRDQFIKKNISRPVIRLSRTELNPQLLISRCQEALQIKENQTIDNNKWNILLQKPVTMINQIVWSTLSEFFDSDEQIIPLALLLRPVIEQNVQAFAKQVKEKAVYQPLEMISESQLLQLQQNTTFTISIPFQAFRQSLRKKLDQFLFSGQDIISILKQLSTITREKNIHPLILIDDIVQSMNIYASELLDYFITLEEGNWDVIIGLTPGALQDSDKGANLMHRILHLDTIDDRIQKLWLTDESGHAFYTLNRNDVVSFLEKYLLELKSSQGFTCNHKCPHSTKCSHFLAGERSRLSLLPLNEPLIERIYDGIPAGKGKLRYIILHTREIIKFLISGTTRNLSRIESLIERNLFADHDSPLLKLFGEMFAEPDTNYVSLPKGWIEHATSKSDPIILELHPIKNADISNAIKPIGHVEEHTHLLHLRDWIEGKKVNEELINSIRISIASLVHEATKATHISRQFTSRQSTTLQRNEVEKGVRYPVSFSNSNNNKIKVDRTVQLLKIYGFHQQKNPQKRVIFSQLSNSWEIANWVYHGEKLRNHWLNELEKALGFPIDVFAFQLRTWMNKWLEVNKSSSILSLPEIPFSPKIQKTIEAFFLDWFALRDNIIDATKIKQIEADPNFEKKFLLRAFPRILERYQITNVSLFTFLNELQHNFQSYQANLRNYLESKSLQYEAMLEYIQIFEPEHTKQILTTCQQIKKQTLTPSLILKVAKLESNFLAQEIYESYEEWKKQKEESQRLLNTLIQPLLTDCNWERIPKTLEQTLEFITNDSQISPSIQNLLLSLINKGEYIIQPGDGKKFFENLYQNYPELSKNLQLHLKLKTTKKQIP